MLFYSAKAQQQTDTTIFGIKLIEVKAGGLFSRFYMDKQGTSRGGYIQDTIEKRFRTGFSVGVSVILINAKHITFQPELVYNLVHHDIKYRIESRSHGDYSYSHTIANYSFDASLIQFSLTAKYRFGKVVKEYLGGGGYYNIPVYHRINGSIRKVSSNVPEEVLTDNQIKLTLNKTVGLFALSGISIPCKRNNFGLEFRFYWTPNTLIETLGYKQSFFTVNLIYQWKRKKNFW
jgi:hypothetical protein